MSTVVRSNVVLFHFLLMQLTLATKITLSRMVFALASIVCLFIAFPYNAFASLACFVIAVATDFIDGRVARARKEVTPIGILLDPLVDKLTVLAILIALVEIAVVPAWMVILILFRELVVTSFRDYAISKGIAIPSVMSGKVKSTLQYLGIALALLLLGLADLLGKTSLDVRVVTAVYELTFYTLLASIFLGYYGMFVIFRDNGRRVLAVDGPPKENATEQHLP